MPTAVLSPTMVSPSGDRAYSLSLSGVSVGHVARVQLFPLALQLVGIEFLHHIAGLHPALVAVDDDHEDIDDFHAHLVGPLNGNVGDVWQAGTHAVISTFFLESL